MDAFPLIKRTIKAISIIGLFAGIIAKHFPNDSQFGQLPLSIDFFAVQPTKSPNLDCSSWPILVTIRSSCQATRPTRVVTTSEYCCWPIAIVMSFLRLVVASVIQEAITLIC